MLLCKSDVVRAAAGEVNTIVKAIDKGADAKQQYDTGDDVGDLTHLDKLEVRLTEDRLGKAGEVLEVALALGPHIGNETANEDTAEQGKQQTDDLRGSEALYRAKAEDEEDNSGKQLRDVTIEYRRSKSAYSRH